MSSEPSGADGRGSGRRDSTWSAQPISGPGLLFATKAELDGPTEMIEETPAKVVPLPLSPRVPDPDTDAVRPVDARGIALTVLTILAGVLTLQWARPLLVPLLIGVFFSYSLDPVVRRLTGWRIPQAVAATLVFVGAVAALGLLA